MTITDNKIFLLVICLLSIKRHYKRLSNLITVSNTCVMFTSL